MKYNSVKHFGFIIICLLGVIAGCKKEQERPPVPGDQDYVQKGSMADLAYNPVRPDGSIDSSYLPIIKFDEPVFDFGKIKEGEVIEQKYTFRNIGTAPLVILNATSTCGCTIPEIPKERIAPGQTGFVRVKFNSKNKEGAQNKEVTIFANTVPNHTRINIKGVVEKNK